MQMSQKDSATKEQYDTAKAGSGEAVKKYRISQSTWDRIDKVDEALTKKEEAKKAEVAKESRRRKKSRRSENKRRRRPATSTSTS